MMINMDLTIEAKKNLFPSKRTYSDSADAYVEIGLWRIIEYYERTTSNISFPELLELPLIKIEGIKDEHLLKNNSIPAELLYEMDTQAQQAQQALDNQYMIFLKLIEDTDMTDFKRQQANEYLNHVDEKNRHRFEKYMMVMVNIKEM